MDTTVFLLLTGGPTSPEICVLFAKFVATAIVPLVALALVVAWVQARPGWRPALLDAVAAAVLGLGLVQVIGWLHYRPRPFEMGLGANLLNHLPENSFPSDHATLMFALAFGLLATTSLRRAGMGLLVLAIAVSWARIYLGAHYPSDILGGAALACICTALIRAIQPRHRLWALCTKAYDRLICLMHLPAGLFPRGRH